MKTNHDVATCVPAAAEPEDAPEQESESGRRNDAELLVVGQILRKLESLPDEDARKRVMDYLYDRFSRSEARKMLRERDAQKKDPK